MKQEIDVNVLMELFQDRSSNSVFLDSLSLFKLTKENIRVAISLFGMSLIPGYFIGVSQSTVSIFCETIGIALDLLVALFGIVFTGYAFFQALINRTLLVRLFVATKTKKGRTISELQNTNENFIELMMVIILSLLVSFFLKILLGSFEYEFAVFSNNAINEFVAVIGITIYLYFIFIVIWEIKSFVFNIFQLFNAHAATKLLDILEDESKS